MSKFIRDLRISNAYGEFLQITGRWRDMDPLKHNEIKVWYSTSESLTSECIAKNFSMLSVEEQLQSKKFRREPDRQRYLITRLMSRELLGASLGIDGSEVRFHRSASGKPHLENDGSSKQIEFNITHCEGLIALALAENPIGIDAEPKDRMIELAVARMVLTAIEQEELETWPQEQRRFRLLQYWTMKEAFVKAEGVGFSKPLDSFRFNLPAKNPPELVLAVEDRSEANSWFFQQSAERFPSHLFSLAYKCSSTMEPRVSFEAWQPSI